MDKLQPTSSFELPVNDANAQATISQNTWSGSEPLGSVPVAAAAPGPAPIGPAAAEDVDLIEKAWVEKAKEIVGRTRNDPHNQNSEMSRFKADYLKKRYSKDVKLNEK